MAELEIPPLITGEAPAALAPDVPLNPPMFGFASPFDHADGQNRDLILEAIRAWARGPLRDWSGAWQDHLPAWLSSVREWLEAWAARIGVYLDLRDQEILDLIASELSEIREALDADIADLNAKFTSLRNEVINSTITITAPVINRVAAKTFPRAPGVPVESFLTDSEFDAGVLDITGVNPVDVYLQRAHNSVPRTPGRPNPFYVGPGNYRMNTGVQATVTRRDVGMVGAGPGKTHFILGPACEALWRGYGDSNAATPTYFENLLFDGFSFDGTEQVASPYESKKGFILGHVRDSVFRNIRGYKTHASMYGVDFQTRVYWENVHGEDAGRGINSDKSTGFGSTFGFGFGATADESVFMTHVGSKRAARHAINLEWLIEYGGTQGFYDGFVSLDEFDFLEDGSGIGALGVALVAANGRIRRPKVAGIIIGAGGQSINGGRNVIVERSVSIEDVQNAYGGQKWLDVQGGHGVVLRGQSAGGARINPTILRPAGSPVYIEPGWLMTPPDRGLEIAPLAVGGGGAGLSYVNGGRMEKGIVIGGFWGHNQDVALDMRTATIGAKIDAVFNCTSKQTTVLRVDPTIPVHSLTARGSAFGVTTLIDGGQNMVNPHTADLYNIAVPSTDPSRAYFSQLVTEAVTAGLGPEWSATAVDTTFTSSAAWYTDREGARPYDGGAGNSGMTGRQISAGQIGYRITATIHPTQADYGRLGIMVCYDAATGNHVRLENYSGVTGGGMQSYQLVRYVGGTRTVMATFGSVLGNEMHQVGIYVSSTGNTYQPYIDGVAVGAPINTSTLAKTAIVGVVSNAQLKGKIRNFKIELMA